MVVWCPTLNFGALSSKESNLLILELTIKRASLENQSSHTATKPQSSLNISREDRTNEDARSRDKCISDVISNTFHHHSTLRSNSCLAHFCTKSSSIRICFVSKYLHDVHDTALFLFIDSSFYLEP